MLTLVNWQFCNIADAVISLGLTTLIIQLPSAGVLGLESHILQGTVGMRTTTILCQCMPRHAAFPELRLFPAADSDLRSNQLTRLSTRVPDVMHIATASGKAHNVPIRCRSWQRFLARHAKTVAYYW